MIIALVHRGVACAVSTERKVERPNSTSPLTALNSLVDGQ